MSELQGNVKIGNGCYIHPGCSILAEGGGEIVIGDYNIIEVLTPFSESLKERVIIRNKPYKDQNGNILSQRMVIGNYNVFEVGAKLESCNVGNCNVFE